MARSTAAAAIPAEKFPVGAAAQTLFTISEVPGLNRFVINESIVLDADASVLTTSLLPAGCVVDGVKLATSDGMVIATGTHIGVGVTGDPDLFEEIAIGDMDAAADQVGSTAIMVTRVANATERAVLIGPTDGSGTLAGTLSGTIYVFVTGLSYDDISL